MTNVVSIGKTCEYLVSRAARHRRAGRYDEAMVLLTKARTQFGSIEEIELETARIYDEIGCEEEAVRSYLRVVRANGVHKAEALFSLALTYAQQADVNRAVSYFQQFTESDRNGISDEMSMLLGKQLLNEIERPVSRSRKARVKALEKKAAQFIQQGKISAAKRSILHAIAIRPTARNYTLLACCCLLKNEAKDAVQSALKARKLASGRVQTLCVLAEALMLSSKKADARRIIYIAALRAKSNDDKLAVAIECAKYGEDRMTLWLADSLLRREPYHMRAMMMRACALTNVGKLKQAGRVFGRICGLLPQNSAAAYFYHQIKLGQQPTERLALGLDVPREEGILRAKTLISKLYSDPSLIDDQQDQVQETVMLCNWAMHSPLCGSYTKTVALIVLGALEDPEAKEALLDCLTDPQLDQSMKMAVLQILTSKEGFKPYLVDIDGHLVRLAAGGMAPHPVKYADAHSGAVQKAADSLATHFPDAPQKILELYLEYMRTFKQPKRSEEDVLAAALEYVYHIHMGRSVRIYEIAKRYHVSKRLCGIYVRRVMKHAKTDQKHEQIQGE